MIDTSARPNRSLGQSPTPPCESYKEIFSIYSDFTKELEAEWKGIAMNPRAIAWTPYTGCNGMIETVVPRRWTRVFQDPEL